MNETIRSKGWSLISLQDGDLMGILTRDYLSLRDRSDVFALPYDGVDELADTTGMCERIYFECGYPIEAEDWEQLLESAEVHVSEGVVRSDGTLLPSDVHFPDIKDDDDDPLA